MAVPLTGVADGLLGSLAIQLNGVALGDLAVMGDLTVRGRINNSGGTGGDGGDWSPFEVLMEDPLWLKIPASIFADACFASSFAWKNPGNNTLLAQWNCAPDGSNVQLLLGNATYSFHPTGEFRATAVTSRTFLFGTNEDYLARLTCGNDQIVTIRTGAIPFQFAPNGTATLPIVSSTIARSGSVAFTGGRVAMQALTDDLKVGCGSANFWMKASGELSAGSLALGPWTFQQEADGSLLISTGGRGALRLGNDLSTQILGTLRIVSGGGSALASPQLAYFPSAADARAAGVPRWSMFRVGHELTDMRVMNLGEPQVGYSFRREFGLVGNIDLPSRDWTLECMLYLRAAGTYNLCTMYNPTRSKRVGLEIRSGVLTLTGPGGTQLNEGRTQRWPALPTQRWVHIVIQCEQNVPYIYIDGVMTDTFAGNAPSWATFGLATYHIGKDLENGFLDGLISNFRITNKAVYVDKNGNVQTFPVPFPLDTLPETKVLLKNWPCVDAVTLTPPVPFSAGWMNKVVMPTFWQNEPAIIKNIPSYDFTEGYVTTTIAALDLKGNWCIQAWLNWSGTTTGAFATWLDFSLPNSTNSSLFFVDPQGQIGLTSTVASGSLAGFTMPVGQWTHVAFQRESGNSTIWVNINGRRRGTIDNLNVQFFNTTSNVSIGGNTVNRAAPNLHWKGSISQVCIHNRVLYAAHDFVCDDLRWIVRQLDLPIFFLSAGLMNGGTPMVVATQPAAAFDRTGEDAN